MFWDRAGGQYYHFVHGKEIRADRANLVHFGGGLNYWFHSRLGARLEMRDHVHSSYGNGIHFWGIRMGLAFR